MSDREKPDSKEDGRQEEFDERIKEGERLLKEFRSGRKSKAAG